MEAVAEAGDDGPERNPECGLRWVAPLPWRTPPPYNGKLLHTCERDLGHEGRHRCSCGRSRVR